MEDKTKRTLLVIDDDQNFCEALSYSIHNESIEMLVAHTGHEGLKITSQRRVDVVLLDQKLPDRKGVTLCPAILSHSDQTKIIFITAYPSFNNAVEAIKSGAYDYLSKPFEMEELTLTVERALKTLALERVEEIQAYKSKKEGEETILIGGQSGLSEINKLIDLAASNKAPVLITGETGSGKNVIAKSIHFRSKAKGSSFVGINCAALPESLIEAELFGWDKGAFTGAGATRKGIFEMAEGGTLLLDEIGSIPKHLQSKLLGVLDDKKVKRLGENTIRPVDVRIIAATNIDIEKAIKTGEFREDLYYRLSVIRCHVPPLRDRLQDLKELSNFFISTFTNDPELNLSEAELTRLMDYRWPGNIRELKNIIERSIILRNNPQLRPSKLLGDMHSLGDITGSELHDNSRIITLAELEKDYITKALNSFANNQSQTARALGISRSTLKRKIKAYQLKSPVSK